MITASDRQEANEWNLHASKCAQSIPCCIAHVQSWTKSAHADQYESMQGEQIGDENVSTPRADHVSIEQGTESSPHNAALLHSFDPQVEGKHQQKDGNGLIIVAAGYTSADVSW